MNTPDDLRSISDRLQRQGVRHLGLTESDEPMDWVGDFISEYFACEQCGAGTSPFGRHPVQTVVYGIVRDRDAVSVVRTIAINRVAAQQWPTLNSIMRSQDKNSIMRSQDKN